jgi:hypothetical protein
VLWLALLLPLAQSVATWHAHSHTRLDAAGSNEGKQAVHDTHCDLCLTAAAVTGGAMAGEPPALPLHALGHRAPPSDGASVWLASPAHPYRSRAPPVSKL